jgi:hypothetical protein
VLEDDRASERALSATLRKIRDFEVVEADEAVISLAERPKLGLSVRRLAYETLASLSTPAAVDFLIDRAVQGEQVDASDAKRALERIKPAGAGRLLKILGADDADGRLAAYRALVRVFQIPNAKPDRFWEMAGDRAREQEMDRVKRLAETRLDALGEQVVGNDETLRNGRSFDARARGRDREGRGQKRSRQESRRG